MESNKIIKCCFCGKELKEKEGNNPEPIIEYDNISTVGKKCCNECNERIVIPAREIFGMCKQAKIEY